MTQAEEDAANAQVIIMQAERDAAKVALEAAELQTQRDILEDKFIEITQLGACSVMEHQRDACVCE